MSERIDNLRSFVCQYEEREDRIKAIQAQREVLNEAILMPEHLRTYHVLNVPSTGKPVYIYTSPYWRLIEPALIKLETKYTLLDRLPRDAGQPSND